MKVAFITVENIIHKKRVGGETLSLEHLKMLREFYGEESVKAFVFVANYNNQSEDIDSLTNYEVLERIDGYKEAFIGLFKGCRIYPYRNEQLIVEKIRQYEPQLIFLDTSRCGRLVRIMARGYPVICFFHNVEADYTWNKIKSGGWLFAPAYIGAYVNEKWTCEFATGLVCLNNRDRARINKLYHRKCDLLLPISFSDRFDDKRAQGTPQINRTLLFVGSLFGPNQEGIEWFMDKVLPHLEGISLDIVGIGFENKKEEYERRDNVHVIGTVDDLDGVFYSHSAVVIPIRYGAGMKVKTCETMMFGRRIFASDEALEGYEIRDVVGITKCNKADEYIKAIQNYYDKDEPMPFCESVRKLFVNKYDREVISRSLIKYIESIEGIE